MCRPTKSAPFSPPRYETDQQAHRFLYALFLALDANFRMQRKDVSSETEDPDLGNGLAFFGEVTAYMKHLEDNWDQPQPVRSIAGSSVGAIC